MRNEICILHENVSFPTLLEICEKPTYANVKEVSITNDGGEGLEGQEIDLKDTSNENPMPLL